MFRQLARLAEEHELLEALPFLRGNADDEDDLIQDAIAALPPLVARFFFAPRGGPKAPPLLGRCFTLKKLSAPHQLACGHGCHGRPWSVSLCPSNWRTKSPPDARVAPSTLAPASRSSLAILRSPR